jgi:SAM-dependent methyltransferase
MVNWLHSIVHNPQKGWDPIPRSYAESYAAGEVASTELIDELERRLGRLAGKRILDLGGGPGEYSVAFAERGANVTWHDVSANYRSIARKRAEQAGSRITFSLGYLEQASALRPAFDLVFCRTCWYYGRNDRLLARTLWNLVAPGGAAYIENDTWEMDFSRGIHSLTYALNRFTGWKIGHPMPPRGRIAASFAGFPVAWLCMDYRRPAFDRVLVGKPPRLPRETRHAG